MLGIHNFQDFEADLSAFPRVVLTDLLGALDRHDYDRDIGLLGDLEDAVMEWEKLALLASCSFRINEDGDFIGL